MMILQVSVEKKIYTSPSFTTENYLYGYLISYSELIPIVNSDLYVRR